MRATLRSALTLGGIPLVLRGGRGPTGNGINLDGDRTTHTVTPNWWTGAMADGTILNSGRARATGTLIRAEWRHGYNLQTDGLGNVTRYFHQDLTPALGGSEPVVFDDVFLEAAVLRSQLTSNLVGAGTIALKLRRDAGAWYAIRDVVRFLVRPTAQAGKNNLTIVHSRYLR